MQHQQHALALSFALCLPYYISDQSTTTTAKWRYVYKRRIYSSLSLNSKLSPPLFPFSSTSSPAQILQSLHLTMLWAMRPHNFTHTQAHDTRWALRPRWHAQTHILSPLRAPNENTHTLANIWNQLFRGRGWCSAFAAAQYNITQMWCEFAQTNWNPRRGIVAVKGWNATRDSTDVVYIIYISAIHATTKTLYALSMLLFWLLSIINIVVDSRDARGAVYTVCAR